MQREHINTHARIVSANECGFHSQPNSNLTPRAGKHTGASFSPSPAAACARSSRLHRRKEGLCQQRRWREIHEGGGRRRKERWREGGRGWERTGWRVSARSRCWSDNETLIRASQMAWWNTWTLSVFIALPLSFFLSLTVSFDCYIFLSQSIFPHFALFHFYLFLFYFTLCSYQSFFSTHHYFTAYSPWYIYFKNGFECDYP